jgi:hypothetical protein
MVKNTQTFFISPFPARRLAFPDFITRPEYFMAINKCDRLEVLMPDKVQKNGLVKAIEAGRCYPGARSKVLPMSGLYMRVKFFK